MDRNLGDRPRWLAANTHPGEDEIALDAHCRLRKEFPGLVTVIAPRHPQRGAEIAELGRHRGLASARRSLNQPLTENTEIYIADTLGEMGLWYSVGRIAFIGGSLVPVGGHNPLEAAHFDVAMVLGPDRRNNLAAAELLIEAEAALVIESGDGVFGAVRRLLADGGERSRVAQAASAAVSVHGDVLDRIVSRLTPALDSLCRTADAAVDHAPA
jgi:3-deoxy-D-manno-octulosonic-acid transferase